MLFIRKRATANFVAILGDGAGDFGFQISIGLHEFWHVAGRDAEQIVQHEHLAVAIGSGTDADGGDFRLLR